MKFKKSLTTYIFLLSALALNPSLAFCETQASDPRLISFYQKAEADYTIYKILKSIDQQDYEAVWKETSPLARERITKENWLKTITGVRELFGPYQSRTSLGSSISNKANNGLTGIFYSVIFTTQFSMPLEETVILSLENGKWKLVGYFLNSQNTKLK